MSFTLNKAILFSCLFLLMEVLILILLRPLIIDFEAVGLTVVTLHALLTIILLSVTSSKFTWIFLIGFLLRFAVLLWDLYARDIFILPHSGYDSEFFYETSLLIPDNLSLIINGSAYRIGFYQKILGVLFWLIGPVRIVAQYLNVLVGLMILVTIHNTLKLLDIDTKTIRNVLLIAVLFPTSLIMSGLLLREIIPTWFAAISFYYLAKWYLKRKLKLFLWAILFVILASMFHSGMIALSLSYIVLFLFYNHSTRKFEFDVRNIFLFIPVLAFIFLFTTQFGDTLFYKFRRIETTEDIFDSIIRAAGGSAYLKGMVINNPTQMLIYGPVRAFYFLLSPLPWDWRGVNDIITFLTDSVIYLWIILYYIKNRKYFLNGRYKILIDILLITIIATAFVYGLGVSNAGTALRHRQKITPAFLLMLGIMMHEKSQVKMLMKEFKLKQILKKNVL